MVQTGAVVAGLLCAAAMQGLAFFMMAAGEGWIAPFYFSFVGYLAFPLAFVQRAGADDDESLAVDGALAFLAVGCDLFLLFTTMAYELQYFLQSVSLTLLPMLWIGLWIIWQVVAISTFLAKRRHRNAELYGGNL